MERTLALVFNNDGTTVLPLMTGDQDEIDEFTSQFEDADQLRGAYIDEIKKFMVDNYRQMPRDGSYKNGQIALYRGNCYKFSNFNYKYDNRVKVLYKKDVIIANEIINQDLLTKLKEALSDKGTKLNDSIISKTDNKYDKLRNLISVYESGRKGTKFQTLAKIYDEYLAAQAGQVSFDFEEDYVPEYKRLGLTDEDMQELYADEDKDKFENDFNLDPDEIDPYDINDHNEAVDRRKQ